MNSTRKTATARFVRSLGRLAACALLAAGTAIGAGLVPESTRASAVVIQPSVTRAPAARASAARASAARDALCREQATALGRVQLAAASASAPVTVWMAGDSTMANAGSCPIGWGGQFGSQFTGAVTVVNRAVAGRSIQTWLYGSAVTSTKNSAGECTLSSTAYDSRWQTMLATSTGMQAGDYLFVQFGINDGDTACPRHVGPARYQELLGAMVQPAITRGVHPVVLTPVAAITCSGGTAVGNRGFITETAAVAASYRVPLIDLHTLSVALYNKLRFCPNSGDYATGAVGAFFCNDHTHFELAGARQIAELVASAVRGQGIRLGEYLAVDPLPTPTPMSTPTPTRTPTPPPTSPSASPTPTKPCRTSYRTVSSWSGGFQGEVSVTNTGSADLGSWTVTMSFAGGQTVTQVWNGTMTAGGSSPTVRDAGWNATIPAGGSVTFGFIAQGAAAAPALTCA